jgi:hypothetical protein
VLPGNEPGRPSPKTLVLMVRNFSLLLMAAIPALHCNPRASGGRILIRGRAGSVFPTAAPEPQRNMTFVSSARPKSQCPITYKAETSAALAWFKRRQASGGDAWCVGVCIESKLQCNPSRAKPPRRKELLAWRLCGFARDALMPPFTTSRVRPRRSRGSGPRPVIAHGLAPRVGVAPAPNSARSRR